MSTALAFLVKHQGHLALACVLVLAIDLALDAMTLPLLATQLLVALAAGLGVSRPSEVAARLAASRSLAVALGLAAALTAGAVAEPPPAIDVEAVEAAQSEVSP